MQDSELQAVGMFFCLNAGFGAAGGGMPFCLNAGFRAAGGGNVLLSECRIQSCRQWECPFV